MEEPIIPYVQKVDIQEPPQEVKEIIDILDKSQEWANKSIDKAIEETKQRVSEPNFNIQIINLMKAQQEMHKKNLMLELSNLIVSIFIFIFLIVIIFLGSRGG